MRVPSPSGVNCPECSWEMVAGRMQLSDVPNQPVRNVLKCMHCGYVEVL